MQEPVEKPHSRNLRLHRQMEGPGAFLITKCVEPREKIIDEMAALEICSSLCFYAETRKILLAAFVVMLDHWHAVLATSDGMTISKRMKILDQWISRQTNALLQASWEASSKGEHHRAGVGGHTSGSHFRCGWQQGFHETNIQSSKQFLFVCVPMLRRIRSGQAWQRLCLTGNGLRQIRNSSDS